MPKHSKRKHRSRSRSRERSVQGKRRDRCRSRSRPWDRRDDTACVIRDLQRRIEEMEKKGHSSSLIGIDSPEHTEASVMDNDEPCKYIILLYI